MYDIIQCIKNQPSQNRSNYLRYDIMLSVCDGRVKALKPRKLKLTIHSWSTFYCKKKS